MSTAVTNIISVKHRFADPASADVITDTRRLSYLSFRNPWLLSYTPELSIICAICRATYCPQTEKHPYQWNWKYFLRFRYLIGSLQGQAIWEAWIGIHWYCKGTRFRYIMWLLTSFDTFWSFLDFQISNEGGTLNRATGFIWSLIVSKFWGCTARSIGQGTVFWIFEILSVDFVTAGYVTLAAISEAKPL